MSSLFMYESFYVRLLKPFTVTVWRYGRCGSSQWWANSFQFGLFDVSRGFDCTIPRPFVLGIWNIYIYTISYIYIYMYVYIYILIYAHCSILFHFGSQCVIPMPFDRGKKRKLEDGVGVLCLPSGKQWKKKDIGNVGHMCSSFVETSPMKNRPNVDCKRHGALVNISMGEAYFKNCKSLSYWVRCSLPFCFDHGSENGCISNSSYTYLLNRAMFHFHDYGYGRKSNMIMTIRLLYKILCCIYGCFQK